jgi:DNA mismatch repair protein MutL
MTKIKVLPDALINQIAAGEVVERPASVLKELVENALDAGARMIEVSWDGAGKKNITVSDDGAGMSEEDALLALERHATSKIGAYDDLFALSTMGFRGEALPSIASVSRFTLLSSEDGVTGTKVEVDGGRVRSAEPRFRVKGTTVVVEDLFFNTPARKKFLRSDATEQKFLHRVFASLAMAHPEASFRLPLKGRTAANYAGGVPRSERLFQVMGADLEKLFQVRRLAGDGVVTELFLSREYLTLPVPVFHHIFVNQRPVQDRLIYAVLKEQHPRASWALFVDIAAGDVDVNIHPAKSEVRFRHPGAVLDLLGRRPALPPSAFAPRPVAPSASGGALNVQEPLLDLETRTVYAWRYLGQADSSFLIFEEKGGLVLVDPHAAHERILFEGLMREGSREVQRLLTPSIIELSGEEESRLAEARSHLEAMGFELDEAGPRRLRMDAQPRLFGLEEGAAFVRTFLGTEGGMPLQKRLLASIACKRAIKIHQMLGAGEALKMMQDLKACADPDHCPHGRPTLLGMSLKDIYRHFGRPTPSD